jgi:hypothetical protein
MSSVRPPGPFRRWLRRPSEVIAAVTLSGVIIGFPLASGIADQQLHDAASANWRGSYDLLVTAGDYAVLTRSADGQPLLDPSYGLRSAPPISNELVSELQAMPDVEVAAPIGFLGRIGNLPTWPWLQIPAQLVRDDPHLALSADIVTSTDDGLGVRDAADGIAVFLLFDATAWDGTSQADQDTVRVTSQAQGLAVSADRDWVYVMLPYLPLISDSIVAVQPDAEARLLRDAAWPELTTLKVSDSAISRLTNELGHAPTTDELFTLDSTNGDAHTLVSMSSGPDVSAALREEYGSSATVAPMIARQNPKPDLRFDVTLSTLAMQQTGDADRDLATAAVAAETSVGTVRTDVTATREPFTSMSLGIPWPGTTWEGDFGYVDASSATGLGGLELLADPFAESGQTVATDGFVPSLPRDNRPPDGRSVGWSQTFRSAQASDTHLRLGSTRGQDGGAPFVVGRLTDDEMSSPTAQDSAPLGIYDTDDVIVQSSRTPRVAPGTRVNPVLSGRGLVAGLPVGYVGAAGAAALGVSDPFTAVRVRVADVENYTADSAQKIAEVARAIEGLGLTTYVVAGSSMSSTSADVGSYAFGVRSTTPQAVGSLGTVEIAGLRLGVAQATVATLKDVGRTVATLSATVALTALIAVGIAPRRVLQDASRVLRTQGYSRIRRARRLAADTIPTIMLAIVAMLGATFWNTSALNTSAVTITIGALGVGAALAVALTRAIWFSRVTIQRPQIAVRPTSKRARPRSAIIRRNALRTLSIGGLVGALSALLLYAFALSALSTSQASSTALGSILSASQAIPLISLAVLTAGSVVSLLIALAISIGVRLRARDHVLRAGASWSARQVRLLALREVAWLIGAGVLVFVLVGWLLLSPVEPALDPLYPGLGVAAIALFAIPQLTLACLYVQQAARNGSHT